MSTRINVFGDCRSLPDRAPDIIAGTGGVPRASHGRLPNIVVLSMEKLGPVPWRHGVHVVVHVG